MASHKHPAHMRVTEHHLPAIKHMALGKRYHLKVQVEPVELDKGESEYGMPMDHTGKEQKPVMSARMKIHSISHDGAEPTAHEGMHDKAPDKKWKGMKHGKAKGRY